MKIFIIILAVSSGYLLSSAMTILKEEEFIFTRYFITELPFNALKLFCFSFFFLIMATFFLFVAI